MRDNWKRLAARAEVVGISFEDYYTQKSFHDQLRLPFPLLGDPDYQAIDRYAGREDNKTYSRPAAYVVDTGGKIKWAYVGSNASDRPPIDEIMKHF